MLIDDKKPLVYLKIIGSTYPKSARMIKSYDIKMINSALNYCRNNLQKHGRYTMVSYLSVNNKIVSRGVNNYNKSNKNTPQIYSYPIPTHSEINCITKHISRNNTISRKMTLYIVGISKSGINLVKSSKPCPSCEIFLKSIGLSRIVYFTTSNNNFEIIEELIP